MKKFYLVIRHSMTPSYHYTFAENEADAKFKVNMKWGGLDDKTIVKEIIGDELNKIVISSDYFG